MKSIDVLIVEDSFYSADLNVRELRKAGFIVNHQVVANKKSMKKALEDKQWDIILSDNDMPIFDALQALELRNQLSSKALFIIVSEDISEADINRAFEAGCCEYISKEHLDRLGQRVREIVEELYDK